MATGQAQGGGVFAWPDAPNLGPETWAAMSGVRPESPLVGGRGVPTGGVDPDYKYRRVALAGAPVTAAQGGPQRAHFSEILNMHGNPIGWVLVMAILYLALAHISLHGKAGFGKVGASAAVGRRGK